MPFNMDRPSQPEPVYDHTMAVAENAMRNFRTYGILPDGIGYTWRFHRPGATNADVEEVRNFIDRFLDNNGYINLGGALEAGYVPEEIFRGFLITPATQTNQNNHDRAAITWSIAIYHGLIVYAANPDQLEQGEAPEMTGSIGSGSDGDMPSECSQSSDSD
jgi:hypothetical protein